MTKKQILKAIISSAIILLPIIFGIIFWNSLPDVMTTHFGADGVADGFAGKGFAVFAIPLIMLALHWICIITTFFATRKNEQNPKVYGLLFYLCPGITILSSGIIYASAFDFELHLGAFISILLGVMFVVLGNYMPKVTRNRTIGIKIKWALESEDNWTATHRVAGRVWFFGGFIVMLGAFLPIEALMILLFPSILILVLIPTIYSYIYYRSQLARGEINKADTMVQKKDKVIGTVCTALVAILLAGVGVIMFTGEITATAGTDALEIKASYYNDISLGYGEIDEVDYREVDLGVRQAGFGSPRLSLGIFKNKEFGSYTLYSYTGGSAHIVIKSDGRTLVIGLESDEETKSLYEQIAQKIGE